MSNADVEPRRETPTTQDSVLKPASKSKSVLELQQLRGGEETTTDRRLDPQNTTTRWVSIAILSIMDIQSMHTLPSSMCAKIVVWMTAPFGSRYGITHLSPTYLAAWRVYQGTRVPDFPISRAYLHHALHVVRALADLDTTSTVTTAVSMLRFTRIPLGRIAIPGRSRGE